MTCRWKRISKKGSGNNIIREFRHTTEDLSCIVESTETEIKKITIIKVKEGMDAEASAEARSLLLTGSLPSLGPNADLSDRVNANLLIGHKDWWTKVRQYLAAIPREPGR
jgi:hypothetical protein